MIRLLSAGVVFIVALLTWRLASPALVNQQFANQIFRTETPTTDSPATETRNIGFDAEVPTGTAQTNPAGGTATPPTRTAGANTLPANPTPAATGPVTYPEITSSPAPATAPVKGAW